MIVDVTCKTDRFNLSVVRSDFINDCCFGEDFSRWLVAAMLEVGIEAHVIGMEDFGWANQATCEGASISSAWLAAAVVIRVGLTTATGM